MNPLDGIFFSFTGLKKNRKPLGFKAARKKAIKAQSKARRINRSNK